jgi:hypothetical protein
MAMPALAPCAYCQSPSADLLTPNGDPVCRACDARFRVDILNHQLRVQAARDPIGTHMAGASPQKLVLVGSAMMLGALAFGAFETFILGRIHLIFCCAIFFGGFGFLARGLR